MMPAAKPKTCKTCRTKFVPVRPLQVVCGFTCAMAHADKAKARATATEALKAARAHREAKEKAKTARDYLPLAQAAFNKYIRLRDAGRPCISCGVTYGKWNAGHYRSVGSNPALRFEPLNNHKQCVQCNQSKSGNAIEYRIGLIARIGQANVDWLEGPHEPKHYSIDDLREIKARYTKLAKEIA